MLLLGFSGVLGYRRRLLHNRLLALLVISALLTGSTAVLIGCASGTNVVSTVTPAASLSLAGRVHGGQQPVAGATIQLYAVGTTGTASASTALLKTAVKTDAGGSFSLTSDYTCPSATTQVYLTATGGNPGLSSGTNNSALAMMTALGPCGSLTASTYIWVNEVTTIGSLAALYPYMTSVASLGSSTANATQLATAFTAVNEYTNTANGAAPGPTLPAGYYASSTEIYSLGNIIASCINSSGGTAGDGSACGTLFTLATPIAGTAPTDTVAAILDILKNPTLNVLALFDLSGATAPFQPSLASAPANWSLPIIGIPPAPTFSVPTGTYTSAQTVTISDTATTASIYYTMDGTTPSRSSNLYTAPITVASSETIQAVAVQEPTNASAVATATYTINTVAGSTVTVLTNANGNITGIPSADDVYYVTATYNNANRLTSTTGTAVAATYVYDWAGQRYSKTYGGIPPTIFSYMQGGTLIAENDNGVVTDYVYVDGKPIAILQTGASIAANQVNYVLADRLGTPQRVANSAAAPASVWSTTYTPFGTTGTVTASVNQGLRLPGQYADSEAGFNYNLNRDYMPNLGRYLESDSLGLAGGPDTYVYTNSNPLKNTDPLGLSCQPSGAPPDDSSPLFASNTGPDLWDAFWNGYGGIPGFGETLNNNLTILYSIYTGGWNGVLGSFQQLISDEFGGSRSPNFIPPTNPAQPPPDDLPPGYSVHVAPGSGPGSNPDYPEGYWKVLNDQNQPIDPSTGKPPGNVTRPESRSQTHVPLPQGTWRRYFP